MSENLGVRLIELIKSLSLGMDLISSAVSNHHVRVGFLAARLSHQLGYSAEVQRDLLFAGLMHDAGALSYRSRLDALEFETDGIVHCEAGYRLVRPYPRFYSVAQYIRHHHDKYADIKDKNNFTLECGNVVNLADRIDVQIKRDVPSAGQLERIRQKIIEKKGIMFNPLHVEAFCDLSVQPGFADQLDNPQDNLFTLAPEHLENEELSHNELLEYTRLFSKIIDYRSSFTATHSRGVAEIAGTLTCLMDSPSIKCDYMRIAGNLHDLGKLAVPESILEKNGPLKDEEWTVMRSHPKYCRKILSAVQGFTNITEWACNHHERIDGKGYPFGLTGADLSLDCQVLAVADVFTAITEDRPYRDGMPMDIARAVLKDMSGSAFSSDVVDLLLDNYEDLNSIRKVAQSNARKEFFDLYEA
ncbi:HD domain-containing phosphohydrolase [Maridesulfovibrio bastinii]|uniref:HD domain-containing phosphohydrolase n=1 Tax=Maridesulfovibrio bastinii TaxID=47157 RepID=UPI00041201B0|nr:HD domain-containing phosphohydrolase [Maridesulfovibrio bastinii]